MEEKLTGNLEASAQDLEKINRHLVALQSAGAVITSSLDLQFVLNSVTQQMAQLLGVTGCTISEYIEGEQQVLLAEYGPDGWWDGVSQPTSLRLHKFPRSDTVIQDQTPIQVSTIAADIDQKERSYLDQAGIKALLILPMVFQDHVVGLVEIINFDEARTFPKEEITIAQLLANQAASAIKNARLYEQAQREIAERRRMETALRESQERYDLAAQGAKDGIWDWDLKTNELFLSARWNSLLGLEERERVGTPDLWFERIHPDDRERVQIEINAHLGAATHRFQNEHRIRHENGTYLWVLARGVAVREQDGKAYRMAGSLSDITERKRAEEQLRHDTLHDSLTGLPNRALFMDRLGRAIERTNRKPNFRYAVLFLDLDQFKVINDSLGHSVGDLLLIAIARRLLITLRSVDTVARWGGDEFVILLEDLESAEDVIQITDRIQKEISLPFPIEEHQIFTTVSIGIVMSDQGYDRPDEVLRDADIAMYQAKGHGRATHQVFTSAMRSKAKARLQLENELRRAIGLQEFRIFYQPILSFEDSRIIGFEALVRWEHPERGLVDPPDFIAVAEETGLIIPIDWWVLRQGCEQIKAWQDSFPCDPPLTISVNLSSKHFARLDLYDQVVNILEVTGLAPEHLILEITENTIIENTIQATRLISKLREMKIQVQIDDFGTGYSSLSYLQKYPIDAIKIDRSFISKMSDGVNHAEIVKTIVSFARELGMEAIAEGVETEAQRDQLKAWNCQYGQGFLISKPMDGDTAQQMMASAHDSRVKNQ